jgi:hypothetical protein
MDRGTIDYERRALDLSAEWEPPVTVFIDGVLEVVCSPFDAIFWLSNHWPVTLPPPEEAQLACYDSMATSRGFDDARCHFINACRKAGWDPLLEPPSSSDKQSR